ncbi:hypothetical protein BDP27DRAFT_1241199 [Rhodocollybia butyracea]|uniref:Uncharacterized protein n=1 Tax=Rhodocollybia butyracea TaxID=206335 RepID=A0A9P5PA72_9AGAR|nr:hypothetical protein BDP27DRAFT_1241199 [Rhodocollybia butyracea]
MSRSGGLAISDLLNPCPNPHGSRSLGIADLLNPVSTTPPSLNDSTVERVLLHSSYQLNRKKVLPSVYRYPVGTVVEYPETMALGGIGHIFTMEGDQDWVSPSRDFAYSRGAPRGNAKGTVEVSLLVDSSTGIPVPCISRHSTCQGVKICPISDLDEEEYHHSAASREALQIRLLRSKALQDEFASPSRSHFEKTSAYLAALKRTGCPATYCSEIDVISETAETGFAESSEVRHAARRGYPEIPNHCQGSFVFGFMLNGDPFIKSNGNYDIEYLEAILTGDLEEAARIETEAEDRGYGPKTTCKTVINHTSQRLTCPSTHRDGNVLCQPVLKTLACSCTFREYEPLLEYRGACPYVLIVCTGIHSHPIPLPEKTPTFIKVELDHLLRKLDFDLVDITPRRFLRHPVVRSYLSSSHLKIYIEKVKQDCFPAGTGWKGLLHIKQLQDSTLPRDEHYIRAMLQISETLVDDEQDGVSLEEPLQIVICMTKEGSRRFSTAQYLQSDIAFKRIIGFYEFEVALVEEYTNTSVTLCRVYLTRQTAFAHLQVLRELDRILKFDNGHGLRWRHIHGSAVDDYEGLILNWVVDQHRGQARGIGLFNQELAAREPPRMDLHQPSRLIQDLGPYEHLRRFLTLCTTHYGRNIRQCQVPEEVRHLMRGLSCVQHLDWDNALESICSQGGKNGESKCSVFRRQKFVWAAICWERSFIPLEIWQARRRDSNVAEIVHADVNLEGTHCTLVGGVAKGKHFDLMKQRALKSRETLGIRESYQSKHLYENEAKNLKRRMHSRHKGFCSEDGKIESHNKKITKAHLDWQAAEQKAHLCHLSMNEPGSSSNVSVTVRAWRKQRNEPTKPK